MRAEVAPITIGVLTAELSNGYAEPIVSELAEAAHELGARLINFVEWLGPARSGWLKRSKTCGTARRRRSAMRSSESLEGLDSPAGRRFFAANRQTLRWLAANNRSRVVAHLNCPAQAILPREWPANPSSRRCGEKTRS